MRSSRAFVLAALVACAAPASEARAQSGQLLLDSATVVVTSRVGGVVHVRAASVTMRIVANHAGVVSASLFAARGRGERVSAGLLSLAVRADTARVELARALRAPGHLELSVPAGVSLVVEGDNGGTIRIEGVGGPAEVTSSNGGVTLLDVSGYAVAATSNGPIEARLTSVQRDTPMSFVTSNGNIDLTLPAGVRATLLVAPALEVESAFDLVAERRDGHSASDLLRLAVNGGGPTIRLYTNNGMVRLHRLDQPR